MRVVEIDGQPWFVAADVCRCLGLAVSKRGQVNVTDALAKVSDDERGFEQIETNPNAEPGRGRKWQRMALVSESGLYKLIMRSDKPEARYQQAVQTASNKGRGQEVRGPHRSEL